MEMVNASRRWAVIAAAWHFALVTAFALAFALIATKTLSLILGLQRLLTRGGRLRTVLGRADATDREILEEMQALVPLESWLANLSRRRPPSTLKVAFKGYVAVTLSATATLFASSFSSLPAWAILASGIVIASCTMALLLMAVARRVVLGYEDWRTPDVALPSVRFSKDWAIYSEQASNVAVYFLVLAYLAVVGFVSLYCGLYAVDDQAFAVPREVSAVTWFYFSVTTVATVGFGDVHPQSTAAQAALLAQICAGPLLLSWLVAVLLGPSPVRR